MLEHWQHQKYSEPGEEQVSPSKSVLASHKTIFFVQGITRLVQKQTKNFGFGGIDNEITEPEY